jgi:hypothetical protein
MGTESLYESVARRKVSLAVVVALFLIVLVIVLTAIFQFSWKVIDLLANTTDLWIWISAVLLGVAANLLTRGLSKRLGEKAEEPAVAAETQKTSVSEGTPSRQVRPQTAMESHSPRQLRYRGEVRAELLRIGLELYNIKEPRLIQFESWNAFAQPDPRRFDIHSDSQHDAVQNLSTALNKRNNYVDQKILRGDQDPEFLRLNGLCLALYEQIRETGFLDVELVSQLALGQEPPRFNLISSSLTDTGFVLWDSTNEHPVVGHKTFKTREEVASEIQRLGLGTNIIAIRHYQFEFIFRNQGQLSANNVRISIDQVSKGDTVQRTIFNTVNPLKEVIGKQDFSQVFPMYLPLGTSMLVPTYFRISIDYDFSGKAQPRRIIRGHCDPSANYWTWEA